jgi:hypothetical protein
VQLGDGVGVGLGDGDHPACHHAGQLVGAAAGCGDVVGAGVVVGSRTTAARSAFGGGCVGVEVSCGRGCFACVDALFAAWVADLADLADFAAFDDAWLADGSAAAGDGGTGQSVETTTEPPTTLLTGSCDEPPVRVRPRAVRDATPTTVAPAFAPTAHAVALSRRAMFDLQKPATQQRAICALTADRFPEPRRAMPNRANLRGHRSAERRHDRGRRRRRR